MFLPEEPEQKLPKKSPQSVQAKEDAGVVVQPVKADHADPAKLNEQELKAAIIAAWKKHEELAKQDLAPMLYWLRDKLRAQGARNDIQCSKFHFPIDVYRRAHAADTMLSWLVPLLCFVGDPSLPE
ncbi:MAG TPA: hypothetical protein VMO80_05380 [Terriglobales bacterium]|nr:hypothetical protein [Terriglobales bacterium]